MDLIWNLFVFVSCVVVCVFLSVIFVFFRSVPLCMYPVGCRIVWLGFGIEVKIETNLSIIETMYFFPIISTFSFYCLSNKYQL